MRPSIAQSVVYRPTICSIILSSSVHLFVVAWVRGIYILLTFIPCSWSCSRKTEHRYFFWQPPPCGLCLPSIRFLLSSHGNGSRRAPEMGGGRTMVVCVYRSIYGCRYACACYWIYLVWFFVQDWKKFLWGEFVIFNKFLNSPRTYLKFEFLICRYIVGGFMRLHVNSEYDNWRSIWKIYFVAVIDLH